VTRELRTPRDWRGSIRWIEWRAIDFFIGTERVTHDGPPKWRATRWWDVDIGDPEIVVWGSPIELGTQDRVRFLRDKLMRTELLPAFEMSDSRVEAFIARIRRCDRRWCSVIRRRSAISPDTPRKRHQARRPRGKGSFVTSERLYDHQREVISRIACPVANGYGGRDAGFIAHACPSGSMHITQKTS
jgi:phenylacetate-CoA ligase